MPPHRLAVLTVSARCSRGEAEDKSGPLLLSLLAEAFPAAQLLSATVPDDAHAIRAQLMRWNSGESIIESAAATEREGEGESRAAKAAQQQEQQEQQQEQQ